MDEREKLRKFRELDDAFAEALKGLEGSGEPDDAPDAPPEISAEEREREEARKAQEARDAEFREQLHSLMKEYAQTPVDVYQMVRVIEERRRQA
ncbi:hypothetical protein [Halomonas cupida]|nr:hypothetical protein HCU01_39350 [Halomonas cupida]